MIYGGIYAELIENSLFTPRHDIYSRIDYFLMFKKDYHKVKGCKIGQRDISDLSGLNLRLHLEEKPKTTLWRLNTGLLKRDTFKKEMRDKFKIYLEYNDNGEVSPVILWDAAKAYLRGEIIAKSVSLKKIKAKKLLDLQDQLKKLEQAHSINKDPTILEQMRPVKQELDKIYSEEIEKKLRHMKQKYFEAGPKASKLPTWRLRKEQAESSIHKIRDPLTNKITARVEGIQEAFVSYYKSLYTQPDKADELTIQDFLDSLDLPCIGKNQNEKLVSENKICLYEDDVLLTLQRPECGVPLLMKFLEMYGRYSGYVLNVQKTQVLTFNYVPSQELMDKHKFDWLQPHIR